MKRLLPHAVAALAAILLFSSCVYDPYYTSSYGSGYYADDYRYSGGYYNGIYSDFYLGFSNNHYRYRHTRCRHCGHYPCRGGHSAHYYTYYQTYRQPLHNHGGNRGRGHSRDDSYTRDRTGNLTGYNSGHGAVLSRNTGRQYSSPRNFSPPSDSRTRGDRSFPGRGSNNYRSNPSSVAFTPPASTSRGATRQEPVRREAPASSSSSTSEPQKSSSSTPTRNVGRNYGNSASSSGSATPRRNVGRNYR